MSDAFDLELGTHRRLNPLTGEWVLVSPGRDRRPWRGLEEAAEAGEAPSYEASCHLCPGNRRASGTRNPDYTGPFVFDNDFPAYSTAAPTVSPASAEFSGPPLFRAERVGGTSRVVCYSPDHARTLPRLPTELLVDVIDVWAGQVESLGSRYSWVQVFENKGALMGCSNPHPHGQIWAQTALPTEARKEDSRLVEYHAQHGRNLLLDYARAEVAAEERIVERNDDWLALVPYWACWPFELLVVPLAPVRHLDELDGAQRRSLAILLKRALTRYDNLFECSFPYSMGWHGRPANAAPAEHWQLHAHFYPPLLRSASVRKFMVGFEMLAEAQRDGTPEQAAERLRAASPVHYLER